MNKRNLLLGAMLLGASTGCAGATGGATGGDYNASKDAAGVYNPGGGGGSGSISFKLDAGASAAPDAGIVVPPEQEQKLDFLAPRAGARYVYVANPTRNTVSVIDSTKLAVTELAPGDSPTYLATVPGQDVALVINAGSHTLRILRGTAMNDSPIPIISKANSIAISPKGTHAVIWFDVTQTSSTSSTSSTTSTTSTGSTQEVSVVDLSVLPEKVFSLSVGYNPSAVVFSNDDAAAFVVTDDGISELRFAKITGDAIAPFTRFNNTASTASQDAGAVPGPDTQPASPDLPPPSTPDTLPATGTSPTLDGGPSIDGGNPVLDGGAAATDTTPVPPDLGPPATPDTAPLPPASSSAAKGKPIDVSVTADGSYAIARRENSSELLLLDLKTHQVSVLDLTSIITDLDLLDFTGGGSAAYAVLREEGLLVRIDIPAGFVDASHQIAIPIDGATIGSVSMSSAGKYAVLYVTATPTTTLVIKDLTTDADPIILDLHKPVRAVAIAPDEQTALVLHTAPSTSSGTGGTSGAGGTSGTADKSFGYSMVHLADGFSKLQQTAADPNPFALTPNSSYAFVLLRDDKNSVRLAERISLTSFIADDFQLGSPPNSIAALSDTHKVFVGQVHPEGRISFIDWDTGDVESVTGFALNGRIQQ